jgi:hypothetical protein
MAGQYGTQQNNLKRTAGVVRASGSPSAVKQNVYQNWKLSTLRDMMANMPRAYHGRAKSLAEAMFPNPVPTQVVPGGYTETNYQPSTGTVNIGKELTPTIPLLAYAHEQSHALQHGPGAQLGDASLVNDAPPSAREIAPTLAGNLAEYEARRRSGGKALNAPTPLTQGYQPSLEWMRQQAKKYGAFSGKPMEELLAENPQYVRLLAQQSGQQGPTYESGSITPQTADAFSSGDAQMGPKPEYQPRGLRDAMLQDDRNAGLPLSADDQAYLEFGNTANAMKRRKPPRMTKPSKTLPPPAVPRRQQLIPQRQGTIFGLGVPIAADLGAAYRQYMPELSYGPLPMTPDLKPPQFGLPPMPRGSYGPLPMTPDLSATPAPFNTGGAARAAIPGLRGDIRQQNAQNVAYGNWMNDVAGAKGEYEAAQQRLRDSEPQYREEALARAYGRAPRQMGQPQVPPPPAPGNIAPAAGMRPEKIDAKGRLLGTIGNQNAPLRGVSMDGQEFMRIGRPAYGSAARNIGDEIVGRGSQTSGFGAGGGMGSSLMRGRLPTPQPTAATERPAFTRDPMIGGKEVSPSEFQQAWKNRKQPARGLASVQDSIQASPPLPRGPSPERLAELASRKAAVKENAIARQQVRRGGLAQAFGAGDEGPDQFESYLMHVAANSPNPQAAVQAGMMITDLRNQRAANANTKAEIGARTEAAKIEATAQTESAKMSSETTKFVAEQERLARAAESSGQQAKADQHHQQAMAAMAAEREQREQQHKETMGQLGVQAGIQSREVGVKEGELQAATTPEAKAQRAREHYRTIYPTATAASIEEMINRDIAGSAGGVRAAPANVVTDATGAPDIGATIETMINADGSLPPDAIERLKLAGVDEGAIQKWMADTQPYAFNEIPERFRRTVGNATPSWLRFANPVAPSKRHLSNLNRFYGPRDSLTEAFKRK